MANKGRAQPRVVCCAIPIARSSGQVLLVTSRKQPNSWVCESHPFLNYSVCVFVSNPILTWYTVPKGGWEPSDRVLEAAASREALEEGPTLCSSFRLPTSWLSSPSLFTTCPPLHIARLSSNSGCTRYYYKIRHHNIDCISNERRREWVDYAEAIRRLTWKTELAQGLRASSLACWVNVRRAHWQPFLKWYSFNFSIPLMPFRDAIKTGTQKGYLVTLSTVLQWILYAPVYFSPSSQYLCTLPLIVFHTQNFSIIN
jgi:diphosphoinositol-polyphosphate diphosphatase